MTAFLEHLQGFSAVGWINLCTANDRKRWHPSFSDINHHSWNQYLGAASIIWMDDRLVKPLELRSFQHPFKGIVMFDDWFFFFLWVVNSLCCFFFKDCSSWWVLYTPIISWLSTCDICVSGLVKLNWDSWRCLGMLCHPRKSWVEHLLVMLPTQMEHRNFSETSPSCEILDI